MRAIKHASFSSPETALLSVSTKNRDLWRGATPELRVSRTSCHYAHAQIKSDKSHWTFPEVAILGDDQKEHGLWGRECRKRALSPIFSNFHYF